MVLRTMYLKLYAKHYMFNYTPLGVTQLPGLRNIRKIANAFSEARQRVPHDNNNIHMRHGLPSRDLIYIVTGLPYCCALQPYEWLQQGVVPWVVLNLVYSTVDQLSARTNLGKISIHT